MSRQITTVCGPIAPETLGFTSMHEHILCDATPLRDRMAPFLPPDAPVEEEEKISLSNLGHLKHAFVLSKDVLRMTDVDTMSSEVLRLQTIRADRGDHPEEDRLLWEELLPKVFDMDPDKNYGIAVEPRGKFLVLMEGPRGEP